ncbi:MAG: BrnT family toxin [Bdellovibrionota bacterium]
MSGLQGKRWFFFVWDEHNVEHLFQHGISPEEAEQVFFNRYVITPNKKKHGPKRYRIDGKTDNGRILRIIFQDVGRNTVRIITGWDL